MGTIVNGLMELADFKGDKPNAGDICSALLSDLGCSVSGTTQENDTTYGNKFVVFDPQKVTNPWQLPRPWSHIFFGMNAECWRLKSKFLHAPTPILGTYPRVPQAGIFCFQGDVDVMDAELYALGGEFVDEQFEIDSAWMHSWDDAVDFVCGELDLVVPTIGATNENP